MEKKVGYENLTFRSIKLEWLGKIRQIEVLPRDVEFISKPLLRKPHHVAGEKVIPIVMLGPQTIGSGLLHEAAAFVFLAAAAWARIIPASLHSWSGGHDRETLTPALTKSKELVVHSPKIAERIDLLNFLPESSAPASLARIVGGM